MPSDTHWTAGPSAEPYPYQAGLAPGGVHNSHGTHNTVSNKPEYKTVVIIERVD